MVLQVSLLFGVSFSFPLYLFVFSGSVCSYNFHWYLTPPQVNAFSPKQRWNLSRKNLHLFLFLTGLVSSGIAAFLLLEHWIWLALTAFLTFMYSAPMIRHSFFVPLRKIAIGKTIYLAFAWTHVTALLPLVIDTDRLHPVHIIYVLNRFFFLYAICIVFDLRDREGDRRVGIKSLVTFLDDKGINRVFWISVLLSFLTGLLLLTWLPLSSCLALLVPSIVLALLYEKAKQSRSDYLYYFFLDGLMALSAPILILLSFAR